MKRVLLVVLVIVGLKNELVLAQKIVAGASISITKANIDEEILFKLYDEKKRQFLFDLVSNELSKGFNGGVNSIDNFTTYYYVKKILDEITTLNNRENVSKNIINYASELTFIYGLSMELNPSIRKTKASRIGNAKAERDGADIGFLESYIDIPALNRTADQVFTMLVFDRGLLPNELRSFNLTFDKENSGDMNWYNNDSKFKSTQKPDGSEYSEFGTFDQQKKVWTSGSLNGLVENIRKLNKWMDDCKKVPDLIEAKRKELSAELDTTKGKTIMGELKELEKSLEYAFESLNSDANTSIQYFNNLKKTKYRDFTMTGEQYEGFRNLLHKTIASIKGLTRNDVVKNILTFVEENLVVQFVEQSSTIATANVEQSSKATNGYLTMDLLSLLGALSKWADTMEDTRKGIGIYFRPTFAIGFNLANFGEVDSLASTDGTYRKFDNLYFASEKIGLKVILYNFKYSHSFESGERFDYWPYYKNRSWKRPPTKPLIDDIFIHGYVSGILYNIADLKSDDNFNYPIAGVGMGMKFRQGFSLNINLIRPISKQTWNGQSNLFCASIDFPLSEYLAALAAKQ